MNTTRAVVTALCRRFAWGVPTELKHAKLGWSRLVGVVAIASAVFCGLGHPVRADLFVSDLNNNNGQVRKFTDTGTPVPAVPFIGGGDGGSLELRGSRIVK